MQNKIVALEGARSGVVLGACVVVLAVLGLTPSLAWIPEAPLLAVAILVPVAILGWTGFRAASRSSRLVAGVLAAGLSGAIGGAVGGAAYLLFGKPAINVLVGLLTGAIGGASIGFLGALGTRRRVGGGCALPPQSTQLERRQGPVEGNVGSALLKKRSVIRTQPERTLLRLLGIAAGILGFLVLLSVILWFGWNSISPTGQPGR